MKLKCYVRNKSKPRGSITEGYIIEECMLFCSKYMHHIETKFNQAEWNVDDTSQIYEGLSIFAPYCTSLGKGKPNLLTSEEFSPARDYVLKNCDEVGPYLQYHFIHYYLNISIIF